MAEDDNAETKEKVLLTFREAEVLLRVSHSTLYKLVRAGLPSHKIGKKRVFFKEEIIQWVKGQ